MERTKYLLIALILLCWPVLYGQEHPDIYRAYISGNMELWQQTIDGIEAQKGKNHSEVLRLINYQYGYIGWCIGQKRSDEAKSYLNKAKETLKPLEQAKYNTTLLYAYKSAFSGFEIGLSPLKAPFIGPKSIENAKRSVASDSTQAMGYLQLGNIAFYAPKMFGGSPTEALRHYEKALQIMEQNNLHKAKDWNYLNILVTLINAYRLANQYEKARYYCLKALAVEPGFVWVSTTLYPQVEKMSKP